MILNAIHWNLDPEIFSIGSISIRWYGLLFATAFIISYSIFKKFYKSDGLNDEQLDKLTVYIIIGTVLGARLGHCLFYEPSYFLHHPLEIFLPFKLDPFKFTGFQGLASHGGAIGILLALWLYVRKYKMNYWVMIDRMVIVAAISGTFIRIGNLANSEIYGIQTTLPWGFIFEQNRETLAKHPTQLYEAIPYLLIFVLLYSLYWKTNLKEKKGFFFGLFLILLFTVRFFVEIIKENQVPFEDSLPLNMGQILSLPFILAGILILYIVLKKNKKEIPSQ